MNEWALSHVCSTDVVPGFKGKGSAMAARSRTPTRERLPSPSWEEVPQISLAAHQALLAANANRKGSPLENPSETREMTRGCR